MVLMKGLERPSDGVCRKSSHLVMPVMRTALRPCRQLPLRTQPLPRRRLLPLGDGCFNQHYTHLNSPCEMTVTTRRLGYPLRRNMTTLWTGLASSGRRHEGEGNACSGCCTQLLAIMNLRHWLVVHAEAAIRGLGWVCWVGQAFLFSHRSAVKAIHDTPIIFSFYMQCVRAACYFFWMILDQTWEFQRIVSRKHTVDGLDTYFILFLISCSETD